MSKIRNTPLKHKGFDPLMEKEVSVLRNTPLKRKELKFLFKKCLQHSVGNKHTNIQRKRRLRCSTFIHK
jgi:hypothetical protein